MDDGTKQLPVPLRRRYGLGSWAYFYKILDYYLMRNQQIFISTSSLFFDKNSSFK